MQYYSKFSISDENEHLTHIYNKYLLAIINLNIVDKKQDKNNH